MCGLCFLLFLLWLLCFFLDDDDPLLLALFFGPLGTEGVSNALFLIDGDPLVGCLFAELGAEGVSSVLSFGTPFDEVGLGAALCCPVCDNDPLWVFPAPPGLFAEVLGVAGTVPAAGTSFSFAGVLFARCSKHSMHLSMKSDESSLGQSCPSFLSQIADHSTCLNLSRTSCVIAISSGDDG